MKETETMPRMRKPVPPSRYAAHCAGNDIRWLVRGYEEVALHGIRVTHTDRSVVTISVGLPSGTTMRRLAVMLRMLNPS
jgi:hypothetical protein